MIKRSKDKISLQEQLREDKNVLEYSTEALLYLQTAMGKAAFHAEPLNEEPKEKKVPRHKEYVECKVCRQKYKRSSLYSHKKTKRHKFMEKLCSKFIDMLLNDN